MTDQRTPINEQDREYRIKIQRLDTKGKVIDFQDNIEFKRDRHGVLDEGKIIINFTQYDINTHRAVAMFKHHIDVDVARRMFDDILNMRFKKDPKREGYYIPLVSEYKGGKGEAAKHPEWELASRRLIVNFNPTLNIGPCIVFNFYLGPGKPTDSGAVLPAYQGEAPFTGQINVSLEMARTAAASILDYINNKQTAHLAAEMLQSDFDGVDRKMKFLNDKLDKVLAALRPEAEKSAA